MSSNAPTPGGANLVMVKATFLHSPHSGRLEKATDTGVWLESLDFTAAIQRAASGVGQAAINPDKQFLKGKCGRIFIPFTHVEWIVADSTVF
jgi:hypothetical protein